MSTRCSVYYEDDGIHIFKDFASPYDGLYLEYAEGSFVVTMPLSRELEAVIMAGLEAKRGGVDPENGTESEPQTMAEAKQSDAADTASRSEATGKEENGR